ncbi:hypothetical protein DE4587_02330 [Mycobacteroides salmoniphilum]|nr:hypothetical protein DE4586_01950 [Mycobacteroides salmoniphilum]TDZ86365.1 hypothetical protein DE4587_02330 [Mycobacteroides salmoniphilum]
MAACSACEIVERINAVLAPKVPSAATKAGICASSKLIIHLLNHVVLSCNSDGQRGGVAVQVLDPPSAGVSGSVPQVVGSIGIVRVPSMASVATSRSMSPAAAVVVVPTGAAPAKPS